jgi:LPXTG-motif cell wall-anchored protein
MSGKEIHSNNIPAELAPKTGIDRNALLAVILGLLTAASILLLIYQANRALQLRIEAAEVWSDYQVKIVKATTEEDPNLKTQYTEEQDVLRQRAQELKQNSVNARYAMKISGYGSVLLLLGAAIAVLGFVAKSSYIRYAGLLLGIVGIGLSIEPLF